METRTLRLHINPTSFTTEVHDGQRWRPATQIGSRPIDSLIPTENGPNLIAGSGDGYNWHTTISPRAEGFWLETHLTVEKPIEINPSMILWLSALDNLDDRQAHTWRQTILRAPTTNQQGLGGNDLPACYLYDHASHIESICYFPPDAFAWAKHRFYNFTMQEIMLYRPTGQYGLGLISHAPNVLFQFEPGTHRLVWWFTQRYRAEVPDVWQAQRILIDTIEPLLDTIPTLVPSAFSWQEMASHTVDDLNHEACWITVGGQTGLRAYVRGTSALKRDEARGFELMTQLDVLFPLLLWQQSTDTADQYGIAERIQRTLPQFERSQWEYVTNNFPPRPGDSFMDTWYFLENALIKLPWVAYLTGDKTLETLFFTALSGATRLARNTHYLFPLFADADGWQPRQSLLNVGVGGLYAAGCVIAYQLSHHDKTYLDEAASALQTMHRLPPTQLTHEPQQLSFAAAAATYLATIDHATSATWKAIAEDFIYLSLRMGYWDRDAAVDFYDPRGMFQACASLCYPAYKENIETIWPWAEVMKSNIGPTKLMAAFMNLQRCHNYAFFDPFLPDIYRHDPCPYIPYEDLATAEFTHTAKLGKELYGAGEVFWSALLFDALGKVDAADILCICLDVPTLELAPIPPPDQRRYLVYNPHPVEQSVKFQASTYSQELDLPAYSVRLMKG